MTSMMEECSDIDVTQRNGIESTIEDTGNNCGNSQNEPQVGMLFKEMEEVFDYYQEYAMAKGFCVNKLSGRKDVNGDYQFITFGCHRGRKAGTNINIKERQRPSRRIGCKARLCASNQRDGRWKINKVILEHNHEMAPSKSKFLLQQRALLPHEKRRLEVNDSVDARSCKTFRSLVAEVEGPEMISCSEGDCHSHLGKVGKLHLAKGDVEAVYQLFRRMQQRDRNFFYEIAVDKTGRMKNVFWADGRCQYAYKEFGDVISLDTMYLVNEYKMPFASFVGINHHGQPILLGCALICNEKVSTFVWVFRQLLRCMGNVAPPAIITDQCASISKAIEIVFPETRHRWCLRYIMLKFSEKMKQYNQYSEIKEFFTNLVFDSVSIDEFEKGWEMMLDWFNLHEHSWLIDLYEGKEKWVPIYVRRYFWGGLSLTQRNESMNSFFDGYIHSRSTLKQFLDQYEVALMNKIEKEMQADFDSMNSKIPTCSEYAIEKQFQEAYTHGIYVQVRKEFLKMMYCSVSLVGERQNVLRYSIDYKVFLDGGGWKRVNHDVIYNHDLVDVSCSCMLFESKGILCSHALCVLTKHDVDVLPNRYILNRWRKDLKRYYSIIKSSLFGPQLSEEAKRVKEMEEIFTKAVDIVYGKDEMCSYVYNSLRELLTKLESWEMGGSRFVPQLSEEA
ncbi:protein FAR-RED IMPAIRED RESPONSE 1 [Jatropha curcas]|uniref:protein FAR-RED IMPAIRED RESPONSE 1 n=1 Tax=Jatropha curcas TaxID=180498 RepID=UPI0018942A7E|nr:protein FAR-RED IMPAIRED RESPONSE 1 [Jatropha curcas]